MSDYAITCEKCGASQEGAVHLAKHLRDDHGMIASQAIRLAKEVNARYREKDEHIRRAAPDLLAACEEAHALLWHYDLMRQENGVDWGSAEVLRQKMIVALSAAIAKARGE